MQPAAVRRKAPGSLVSLLAPGRLNLVFWLWGLLTSGPVGPLTGHKSKGHLSRPAVAWPRLLTFPLLKAVTGGTHVLSPGMFGE